MMDYYQCKRCQRKHQCWNGKKCVNCSKDQQVCKFDQNMYHDLNRPIRPVNPMYNNCKLKID